jgi:hypothetical protein
LDQLEAQVEQHRAEQHIIFDRLIKAGLLEPQIEPYITLFRQQRTRRYRYHPYAEPMSTSSSRRTPSPIICSNSDADIVTPHHKQSHPPSPSPGTADKGSRENPIYVFDDNELRCEGCWDEGHFIGDCKRVYRYDGQEYVPIREGDYLTEPTYVIDADYYRRDVQNFKQKAESPQHSKTSA